jgi:hypothetical protein
MHLSSAGRPGHGVRFPPALVVLLLALAFGACSDATSPSVAGVRRQAALNRARWNAQHLDSYSYEYSRYCFCVFEVVGVRIEVRDGEVVGAWEANDAPVQHPLSMYPTVNDLFDFIDEAARSNPDFIDAKYDAERHYPTAITVDYNYSYADDEIGHQAGGLVPR